MNNADKARELREQADKLLSKAKELEDSLAEKPAEVWAYIGTEVTTRLENKRGTLTAKLNTAFGWRVVEGNGRVNGYDVAYINGQVVTHFQPIKAEVRHDDAIGKWDWYVNNLYCGSENLKHLAFQKIEAMSRRIAPWWQGELVITERV